MTRFMTTAELAADARKALRESRESSHEHFERLVKLGWINRSAQPENPPSPMADRLQIGAGWRGVMTTMVYRGAAMRNRTCPITQQARAAAGNMRMGTRTHVHKPRAIDAVPEVARRSRKTHQARLLVDCGEGGERSGTRGRRPNRGSEARGRGSGQKHAGTSNAR